MGSGRRKYVPHDSLLPRREGANGTWHGHFGTAIVKGGIPPPEKRSLQADIWWLIDNVLKVGDCMDINRNFDQIRVQVARYIRERKVGKGIIKVRPLEKGGTRIWKLDTGYEKPDS